MVPRPLLLRASSGVVATLAAGLLGLPATAAAGPGPATDHDRTLVPEDYDAPLVVTIDELTPGEVPRRGPVVVAGRVSNRDVETWRDINLHTFINDDNCTACPPPITTEAELEEAAATDPETVVGNRITAVTDTITELAPGEVEPFRIRIPRRFIAVSRAGVYWFGVHALGSSDGSPRDTLADGRARTFLPYVPQGRRGVTGSVETAVVVPLRYRIAYQPNGSIASRADWRADLGPYGDLGGPLAFGAAAVSRPMTWLVDPALPDAVRRLARGNPGRDLGPRSDDAQPEEPEESGTASDGGATDDGEGEDEEQQVDPPADPTAVLAQEWLDDLETQLRGEEVLALPYGDLDMSATPTAMPELYGLARERAGDVLTDWEIATRPAVASPGGYLDPGGIDQIDDDSVLLMTDRMFGADAFPDGPPGVATYGEHAVAVTSYAAATGGPGPDPRLGAVSFRQRVLGEAALRVLRGDLPRPLVVVASREVTGEGADQFWSGLDVDWVELTTVSDATAGLRPEIEPADLTYPPEQSDEELDQTVYYEVDRLVRAGATLQNMLTDSDGVGGEVRDEALAAASYGFRNAPRLAARNLGESRAWIERRLRAVRIDAPPGVTLSSADGTFAATVHNRLPRTVTVRVAANSPGNGVTVDTGEPVVLAAKSRTTVLLDAHASSPGVHNVILTVTDVDGTPLGSSDRLPVRSNQVSDVIWVILGVGGGILFLAIVLRLYRRFRPPRRTDGALGADGTDGTGEKVTDEVTA